MLQTSHGWLQPSSVGDERVSPPSKHHWQLYEGRVQHTQYDLWGSVVTSGDDQRVVFLFEGGAAEVDQPHRCVSYPPFTTFLLRRHTERHVRKGPVWISFLIFESYVHASGDLITVKPERKCLGTLETFNSRSQKQFLASGWFRPFCVLYISKDLVDGNLPALMNKQLMKEKEVGITLTLLVCLLFSSRLHGF